jgi:hypothetical protein
VASPYGVCKGIRHRCNVVRPRNACVPMPSGRLKPARTVLVAGEDHSQDGRIAFPPWPPAFLKASARLLFMYRQRGAGVVELWQWQSSEPNAIVVDAPGHDPRISSLVLLATHRVSKERSRNTFGRKEKWGWAPINDPPSLGSS